MHNNASSTIGDPFFGLRGSTGRYQDIHRGHAQARFHRPRRRARRGLVVVQRDDANAPAVVRALINDITVNIEEACCEIVLTIHWKGGRHSTLR
ncbi:hypothetical protein REMIM1_PE00191 (plasmid) [Rhizobium etli bv. mimosae str. Mim1]|nr:hypothetical protein REMIM1_PE00191 [Rhizobium etli bv. mimosae str. Mim1]